MLSCSDQTESAKRHLLVTSPIRHSSTVILCCSSLPARCSAISPLSIAIPPCVAAYATTHVPTCSSSMRSGICLIRTVMPTCCSSLSAAATKTRAQLLLRIDHLANGTRSSLTPPASSPWSTASSTTPRSSLSKGIPTVSRKPRNEPNSAPTNAGRRSHDQTQDPLAPRHPAPVANPDQLDTREGPRRLRNHR